MFPRCVQTHCESERALFYECIQNCVRKPLDTTDIVREAILRELSQAAQGAQIWLRLVRIAVLISSILFWPNDATRVLVTAGGADAWFWLHVAQALIFTALALIVFMRLLKRRSSAFEHTTVASS